MLLRRIPDLVNNIQNRRDMKWIKIILACIIYKLCRLDLSNLHQRLEELDDDLLFGKLKKKLFQRHITFPFFVFPKQYNTDYDQ